MRYLLIFLTLIFHFTLILTVKLLDNFSLIIVILFASLILGLIILITARDKKSIIREFGWGLFFGSLTSIALTIMFIIYLSSEIGN